MNLLSTEILKSIIVLLYVFLTVNEFSTFTFVVEVIINPRIFSQVLATVIKLFKCSILYFEMHINFLNVEC